MRSYKTHLKVNLEENGGRKSNSEHIFGTPDLVDMNNFGKELEERTLEG